MLNIKNIKKINRAKRIAKARNVRKNNYGKGILAGPVVPKISCWYTFRNYIAGFVGR